MRILFFWSGLKVRTWCIFGEFLLWLRWLRLDEQVSSVSRWQEAEHKQSLHPRWSGTRLHSRRSPLLKVLICFSGFRIRRGTVWVSEACSFLAWRNLAVQPVRHGFGGDWAQRTLQGKLPFEILCKVLSRRIQFLLDGVQLFLIWFLLWRFGWLWARKQWCERIFRSRSKDVLQRSVSDEWCPDRPCTVVCFLPLVSSVLLSSLAWSWSESWVQQIPSWEGPWILATRVLLSSGILVHPTMLDCFSAPAQWWVWFRCPQDCWVLAHETTGEVQCSFESLQRDERQKPWMTLRACLSSEGTLPSQSKRRLLRWLPGRHLEWRCKVWFPAHRLLVPIWRLIQLWAVKL